MSNEKYGGSAFNPDGPTAEADQPTRRYDRAGRSSQRQPSAPVSYNPDAPTADDGAPMQRNTGAGQPSQRQPSAPVSYNPDAPTEDSSELPQRNTGTGRPSQELPFRSMYNPDQPTAEDSGRPGISGAVSASRTGGSAPFESNLPFKPMGGGRRVEPPSRNEENGRAPAAAPPPVKPAQEDRRSNIPEQIRRDDNSYYPKVTPDSTSRNNRGGYKDHHSLTLPEMQRAEDLRYEQELKHYQEELAKWKGRIWIPFAMIAVLVLLILLAGAFIGGLGIVVVILAAGISLAILTAAGKMNWLKRPRKPKKQMPELATPELTSVYSVRLRLKSLNLPKPVEVTIRKEEQLLGSDQVLCIHPLQYKGISHRHCTIISKNMHGHTSYMIRDEGSKNGTRLNDQKLEPGVEYPMKIGDVITLAGRYQFKVVSDAY